MTDALDLDKPVSVKSLTRSILELTVDEALRAGLVFSYHIFLPEPHLAMLSAVEKCIAKTRAASREKKERMAETLCALICKWVQYRLKTEFRLPLSTGLEVSGKKKKKSIQHDTLMDALLYLLRTELQPDETLTMSAYKIKLTMLKTSQSRSSRRRQYRNRLQSIHPETSPATTGTDEEPGDSEQKVPSEPLESTESAECEQEISSDASSTTTTSISVTPTTSSVAFADCNDPSPRSVTEDDDTITDNADDDDISVDIRRARGIVPSLSFLAFDELEDAAISPEPDAATGGVAIATASNSSGSSLLAEPSSTPSLGSEALSTSAPKRASGFADADGRFSFSPLNAFSPERRKPGIGGMRKMTLQQMLLAKAKQLTLLESESLQAIQPMEFFKLGWQKDTKRILAPRIVSNLAFFNGLSYWVSFTLCDTDTVSNRIGILKQHLTLAELCFQLCNYNSLMAILGGLNNASVQRLKQTWAGLSPSFQKLWKRLNTFMDSRQNYAKYRAAITEATTANTPVVPFLGVILRDFAFIEEGNDDYADPKQKSVNLNKIRLIGNQLLLVERLQRLSSEYAIVLDRSTRKFWRATILPAPEDADDILYARSCEVEPKQP